MKNIGPIYFKLWRPAIFLLAIAVLAYVLFFHNIGHFLPGYSAGEANTYNSSNGIKTIADHPMGAPYKLFVYAAMKLGHHSLLITRVVAASFGILACFLFFIVARAWFSYRIAFLVTILFATSSGFLHVARLGSELILQMGILLIIAAAMWWQSARRSTLAGFAVTAAFAVLLYVPGMIWFELLAVLTMHQKVQEGLRSISWQLRIAGAALFLVIIAPLVRAMVLTPSTIFDFAGLPAHFASLSQTASNIGNSLLSVAVHSNGRPELWLAHVPLLNVIELVLLLLGIYVYINRKPRERSFFLLVATLLSLVLIGVGGAVNISSLLPLLYLIVGAGLYELLQLWFRVFPRNPVARFTGVFFICLLVFFSALFQYRAYFVAWPNNHATEATFTRQHI